VPNWIVEYLVKNLYNDLKSNQYISASVQDRSLLEFSKTTYIPPEVLQLAQKTMTILEQKGFTEQKFIMGMQRALDDSPAYTGCNAKGMKKPLLNGSCEEGYIPLLGTDQKTKCCVKMKKELEKMDEENQNLLNQMTSRGIDLGVRQEFADRFALNQMNPNYGEKVHMLSGDVPDHTRNFIKATQQEEITKLTREFDVATKENRAHTLFGMSATLLNYMLTIFGGAKDFIVYYVSHDWSYWWIGIYLFRFLSLFVCMWISLESAKEFMDKLAEQYLGFKPITLFLVASWGPALLAPMFFSAVNSIISNNSMVTAVFSNLSQALGSFMTTGFLHLRIMNLLSSVGFIYDFMTLIRDIFHNAVHFTEKAKQGYMEGKGIIGSLTYGAKESLSFYCKAPLKTFFQDSAKIVQSITVNLLYVMCVAIQSILTGGLAYDFALKSCSLLRTAVEYLFEAIKPNPSLQSLIAGNPYGADTIEEASARAQNFNSFDTSWGQFQQHGKEAGGSLFNFVANRFTNRSE
jgi:hypothetical protein